jgi:hypothetical protein
VGDGGGELASCTRSQYAKILDYWWD